MKKEQVETSIEKNVQNFETQFKKSTTQLLILHLLSKREISENNRVRVYYRITERGIHYLNEITGAYSRLSQSVSSILFGEVLLY